MHCRMFYMHRCEQSGGLESVFETAFRWFVLYINLSTVRLLWGLG